MVALNVSLFTCSICSICLNPVAATPHTTDNTDLRIAAAMQEVQRFNSSGSLDDLQTAVSKLLSAVDIGRIRPKNYVERRRTLLQAWAQILEVVERLDGRTFALNNPKDFPQDCVQPPLEANGQMEQPCADPSTIRDPKARAAYVAAIAANAAKAQRVNFQARLARIDEDAMVSLRGNMRTFHRVAAPDYYALDTILQQAHLSMARRRRIDAMF